MSKFQARIVHPSVAEWDEVKATSHEEAAKAYGATLEAEGNFRGRHPRDVAPPPAYGNFK